MLLEKLYRVVAETRMKFFEFAGRGIVGANLEAARVFRERRAGRDGRRRGRALRRGADRNE
jgi:hypothetical protein